MVVTDMEGRRSTCTGIQIRVQMVIGRQYEHPEGEGSYVHGHDSNRLVAAAVDAGIFYLLKRQPHACAVRRVCEEGTLDVGQVDVLCTSSLHQRDFEWLAFVGRLDASHLEDNLQPIWSKPTVWPA